MNKQDFLLKLKDPETYDLISEGIRRTVQYYASTFKESAWFEVPRANKGMRTWHIIFEVEFGAHFPSLHVEDDIKHNFKQGDENIHVRTTSFNLTAKTITVFVTRYK